jgi:putative CocE/NonD family hydrolase
MTEEKPTAMTQSDVNGASKDGGDIAKDFSPPDLGDYIRREVMIPMRDGVKLHTVIMIPKDTSTAPIMLDRTPYNASKLTRLSSGPRAAMQLYAFHADLIHAGYLLVLQDIRGMFKSEGDFTMNLPLRGNLNPGEADHSTDAWDTIDWLVKNVAECNGRVGTVGISFDGFTSLMSLVDAHPALKACVPINPMVDNWKGDDWFHNGAFRQSMTLQYVYHVTASKNAELTCPMPRYDEYATWLEAGSAAAGGAAFGADQLPFWKRLCEHPDYDAFWQQQAVDRILASRKINVPTLNVHSQWDAEDIYGAMAVHQALEQDPDNASQNYLVIGPWSHASVGFEAGYELGAFNFGSDTASWFRREVMIPFLNQHLMDKEEHREISRVTVFETGADTWHHYDRWPLAGAGSARAATPLYLAPGSGLDFSEPKAAGATFDEYLSNPAKPVTYQQRPIRPKGVSDSSWDRWLLDDQRFAADRPDVLTYCSPVLTNPVRIAGQPIARLFASTTGSDCDWVVKLIDVYPDNVPQQPALGGYQLPVAMDILRGRYRNDPAVPEPITPGEIIEYRLPLPHVCHAFLPGHRIMVQIQSSWFPLYDRNPQSFVENIFFARPDDFIAATQRVYLGGDTPSHIELPVIP